jgi:hypothetical protein
LIRAEILSAVILLVATIAAPEAMRARQMTDNQNAFEAAGSLMVAFEKEQEPERLREAYMALENVMIAAEPDPAARAALRRRCLAAWLHLLALLDRFRDPKFRAEDVPEKLVSPPAGPGDVILRPGVDPAKIADAEQRRAYEAAIAANRAKAAHYREQIGLGYLEKEIPVRAEAFIRKFYTLASGDKEELRQTIEETTANRARKEQLLELVGTLRP